MGFIRLGGKEGVGELFARGRDDEGGAIDGRVCIYKYKYIYLRVGVFFCAGWVALPFCFPFPFCTLSFERLVVVDLVCDLYVFFLSEV